MMKKLGLVIPFLCFVSCYVSNNLTEDRLKSIPALGEIKHDTLFLTNTLELGALDFEVQLSQKSKFCAQRVVIEVNELALKTSVGFVDIYKVIDKTDQYFLIKKVGRTDSDGRYTLSSKELKKGVLIYTVGFRATFVQPEIINN